MNIQTCRCHALLLCYHFLSALAGTQCVDWLKNLSEPDILWISKGRNGNMLGRREVVQTSWSFARTHVDLSLLVPLVWFRGAITSSCAFSWASLYTPVQKIKKRKLFAKALAALKQGVGKQSFSETNYRGGRWPSGRKSPLDSAHIDGLSALYIHENLRIDMVMDAFVRFMAFVKDKIHPNKPYVDTSWFTKKWRNWGQKLARSLVLSGLFSTSIVSRNQSWLDAKLDENVETIHNMKIKGEWCTIIKIGLAPQRTTHFWIKQFHTSS